MTLGQKIGSSREPWWAPRGKKPVDGSSFHLKERMGSLVFNLLFLKQALRYTGFPVLCLSAFAASIFCALLCFQAGSFMGGLFFFFLFLVSLVTAFFLFVVSLGHVVRTLFTSVLSSGTLTSSPSNWDSGIRFLNGTLAVGEPRTASIPAPELALGQFVQQVRAYANEKSFQKSRDHNHPEKNTLAVPVADAGDLLKRRWNEVLDSLGEFEIYLAHDPAALISKLVAKFPAQSLDVSQIFREVAESFDSTWRRRGITIEAAIVTPLRATVNDGLLRRLLVGPWRAAAYLARRGNGVVFSAKQAQGIVTARWEVSGLTLPESFLQLLQDRRLTVNARIEHGMAALSQDPNNANVLFGLLSLILWVDLVIESKVAYVLKHNNEGFVIEMKLGERRQHHKQQHLNPPLVGAACNNK